MPNLLLIRGVYAFLRIMKTTAKIQSILNHNSMNKNRVIEIEKLIKDEIKESLFEKEKELKLVEKHNQTLIVMIFILLPAALFFILSEYLSLINIIK